LDVNNYDLLLGRLSELNLQNKELIVDGLQFCNVEDRDDLINNLGWTITGDWSYYDCVFKVELSSIENHISIYPNPTQNILHIEVKNNQEIEQIKIYNLSGLELMNVEENKQLLNLESLSTGVYFINIQTNLGTVNKRFIKN